LIGSNLPAVAQAGEAKQFVMASRLCRMDPTGSVNLENFLRAYRTTQRYLLAPSSMQWEDGTSSCVPAFNLWTVRWHALPLATQDGAEKGVAPPTTRAWPRPRI